MAERGFEVALPPDAARQLAAIESVAGDGAATPAVDTGNPGATVRDLRALPWSSIDNLESRDLDQVEWCERLPGGDIRVLVGIADVDALVPAGTPLDRHAAANTTSVYTGAATFPMLPEPLSTDLTSLGEGVARRAIVVDLVVRADGTVARADAYRALVVNHRRLAYEPVGDWLDGAAPPPPGLEAPPFAEQLRMQDEAARRLRAQRRARGALELETIEAQPVAVDGRVIDLRLTRKSRARELIEDFMIAVNVAIAELLEGRGIPSIRRVVHTPRRWARLVALAASLGETLPPDPDAAALADFVVRRRAADPERFADLSLSIVKLLGPGEYAVDRPGRPAEGHFGLAAPDYTHSTAPNRRYADLVTQRMLEAALAGAPCPYSADELEAIARRCTEREDAARDVERRMRKEAAALLVATRVGERFGAIVTGVNERGTFVRLLRPPVEGRVVRGEAGLDVGDAVDVELVATDPERGFIDFAALPR